jgi:hypothetical protein
VDIIVGIALISLPTEGIIGTIIVLILGLIMLYYFPKAGVRRYCEK